MKREAEEEIEDEHVDKKAKIHSEESKEEMMETVEGKETTEGNVIEKQKRLPKKMYILLVGYLGTGYKGLQINPGFPTIEADLSKAIYLAGGFLESNYHEDGKLQVNKWSRAARTDKGVHAMGNVIGCNIQMAYGTEKEFAERVNSHLPPTIRVYKVMRTTGQFIAHKAVDHRQYEYFLPSFMLQPPKGLEKNTNDKEGDIVVNDEEIKLIGKELSQESKEDEDCPDAQKATDVEEAAFLKAENKLGLLNEEERKSFRVSSEGLSKLREALRVYKGTHDFHNYTNGVRAGEARGSRYIMEFTANDPVVVNDYEWIRLRVIGQSFMLHQIRKMVSMAVEVAKGAVSLQLMRESMSNSKNINLPVAPPTGLYLDACVYNIYNKKIEKQGYPKLDFENDKYVKDMREEFKKSFLFPHIVKEEEENKPFAKWLVKHELHRSTINYEITAVDKDIMRENRKKGEELKRNGKSTASKRKKDILKVHSEIHLASLEGGVKEDGDNKDHGEEEVEEEEDEKVKVVEEEL